MLTGLAPHLPAPLLAEAVNAARDITDDFTRAQVLTELAPHLPAPLLVEAVSAARDITNEDFRAQVLTGLAPHLPAPLLVEAVSAARDITDEYARAQALAGLTPHLPEPDRGTTFAEALSAARDTDEYARAQVLAGLVPHITARQLADLAEATRSSDLATQALLRLDPLARRLAWGSLRTAVLVDEHALTALGKLGPALEDLASREGLRDLTRTVHRVGRWRF